MFLEGIKWPITIDFLEKSATIKSHSYCQFFMQNSPYLLNDLVYCCSDLFGWLVLWHINHFRLFNTKSCLGTKHSGLPFQGLWAELPTITWPLVIWHFQKWILLLFGSKYQSEKTPLFCLRFFSQHYPLWTFFLTPEKM